MAYSNYRQNNYSGQYQQKSYGQTYQKPAPAPFDLDTFIANRLDVYSQFIEQIKARGLDPADFAFALGGWVTSACLSIEKGK